jgi:lysophospholipase L1-like esterase
MQRAKKSAVNVMLFLGTTVVMLVIVELVARMSVSRDVRTLSPIKYSKEPAFVLHPNPDIIYSVRPYLEDLQGQRITNRLGFRERDFSERELASHDVILMLGDSIAWGVNVDLPEQRYSTQLEELLNRAYPDNRFLTYNTGISGYNTWQEFAQLRELFPHIHPKLVIVGFCLNDSGSAWTLSSEASDVLVLQQTSAADSHGLNIRGVFNNLVVYMIYKDSIKKLQQTFPTLFPPALLWYNLLIREQRWQDCKGELLAMQRFLADKGVHLVIAIFPFGQQLKLEEKDNLIQSDLLEYCNSNGLLCLDLFPFFKDNVSGRKITDMLQIGDYDVHPDAAGHAVAAQALFGYLVEKRLVPFHE